MTLREGDIVLVQARRWLGVLAWYDHAALVYPRDNEWYSIEAGFSGVRDWRYGQWPRTWVVCRPQVPIAAAHKAVSAAMRWRGEPYAWWHLPAVFRRMLGRKRVEAARRRVCTELVVDAYRELGYDLTPGIDHPSPDDIAVSELVKVIGAGAPGR